MELGAVVTPREEGGEMTFGKRERERKRKKMKMKDDEKKKTHWLSE